ESKNKNHGEEYDDDCKDCNGGMNKKVKNMAKVVRNVKLGVGEDCGGMNKKSGENEDCRDCKGSMNKNVVKEKTVDYKSSMNKKSGEGEGCEDYKGVTNKKVDVGEVCEDCKDDMNNKCSEKMTIKYPVIPTPTPKAPATAATFPAAFYR
ncbi:16419_t:CDS:2, partial [Cetraspora pellucida]